MKGMVDGFGNDVGERGFRRPERDRRSGVYPQFTPDLGRNVL
jgi:hypothetical protein